MYRKDKKYLKTLLTRICSTLLFVLFSPIGVEGGGLKIRSIEIVC